jgi:hypothetical protein
MTYSISRLIVYVDNYGRSCPCEEREEHTSDKSWILYRCIYCHDKELKETCCLGTTQYGVRCKSKYVDYDGYCNRHRLTPRTRIAEDLSKVDISLQYNWKDYYRAMLASHAKRSLLRHLQFLVDIRKYQLLDILDYLESRNTYVYFIQCKNYVKVGRSDNPENRLKNLQQKGNKTLRPKDITDEDMQKARIIATIHGKTMLEGFFHSKLKDRHVNGEWFVLDSYTAKVIDMTQDSEFSLKDLIQMAEEEPFLLEQDTKTSRNLDDGIDDLVKEEEDSYNYYKERYNEEKEKVGSG